MNQIQVVILVNNSGITLYPFTENQSLYFLQVANKPLLAYTLEALLRNGLSKWVFVCTPTNREDIKNYVSKRFHWPPNSPRTFEFYCPEEVESSVTSISKLYAKGVLQKDLLVVNGDTISDCSLVDLRLQHYGNHNLMTVAFNSAPGSKEVLLLEHGTPNLLKMTTVDEIRGEGLKLKKVVLRKFGEIDSKVGVTQTDIVLFSRQLLPVFSAFAEDCDQITRDLVPFLLEHQFNRRLKALFAQDAEPQACPVGRQGMQLFHFQGYSKSIRTLGDYCEANADAITNFYKDSVFSPSDNSDRKKNEEGGHARGPVNIMGSNATVPASKDIKKSIFGRGCVVGANCKIENCVFMNEVEVEDGCEVKDSVIGSRCRIKTHSKVTNCFVGSMNIIKERSVLADDSLQPADTELEIKRKMSTM